MIDLSLVFTFFYFWSRKYGLRSVKMRRKKRVLLIVFTVFCGAVFYGYSQGKGDASNQVNDRKIVDRYEDTPYGNLRPRHNDNGRHVVMNQVLQAMKKPDVVKFADQNNEDHQVFGNDAHMSDNLESNNNVFRGNRKKFAEPISLKAQVPGQQNGVHDQVPAANNQPNRAFNPAPPGVVPPKNAPEPPGNREDKARLQKLQQELEDRQREVQRHQALLKEQNDQMQQLKQQQYQQNELLKRQREEHEKQLQQMHQQALMLQQQQAQQPAGQPQQQQPQEQFQPQQQQQPIQPQFQPQPQQQPQFQPQPQQPQFQPQPQQPQFQPQPQQPGVNNQQLPPQQPAVNIAGMQGNNQQGVQQDMNQQQQQSGGDNYLKNLLKDKIHLSVVCCGDRLEETTVMLKSAAIFTQTPMHFHIFAEDELQEDMSSKLNSWPAQYRRKFSFNIYPISYPAGQDPAEWKKVFKLCATQRLFLPDLLKNVDSVLYVDTDILFMRPLERIWHFFKEFNSTQFAAMTPEHEIANIGWYNRFGRHPYYGLTGLNSGVMLMNLTRMRSFDWTNRIVPLYREWKTKITWGDQDLINILFHFHPESVFVYPCEWNFRPDACMYSLNCHRINDHGVSIIHGNRGVYHNEKQLPFRAIYEAFHSYEFGTDLDTALVQGIRQRFGNPNLQNMYCTKALLSPLMSTLEESTKAVNSAKLNGL